MADPLSVAGSIVGLISLGLSVTQHIFDYYAAAKDRETKLGGTIAKLEQLLKVFEAIRTQAEARKTRPDEHGLLSNMLAAVQRCEECIEELREEADKFREYPGQARRLGTAARATVRRITYPFRQSTLQRIEEDIDEILSQLSVAQQALIQNELSHVRDDVEDTKALLEQVRASQISLEIRQWLDAPDATTNFNLACANKHPGTGLWLVRGSPFSEWLQKPNSFLWLRGFAGCGKSVLSSTAIQHTYRHLRGVPKAGIAFFYFSFSDSSKQSVEAMLRALILQLSSQIQGDSQLLALYRRHREGTPPYQGLITCLFQIVQQFSDVYIVVDALDESPRGPYRDAVLQALAEMRTWSSGPKLHLLVTSRDEIDIREELQANPEEVVVIKNDSVQRDIALFVSQHLRQNRRLRKWERYHDRIEEILTTRAKGVFRWVECQFKALASCPRSEHLLEQLLQSLPETLDETYRRMLLNIPSPSAPYARQMLTLLCCSERPLKVSELVDAVAVELADHQTPRYNPKRRLEDEYALQEVCLGFTELGVDPRTGEPTIQIAHSSVQEFLESERLAENDDIKAFSIERTSAHTQMAHICLTFLLDPNLAFSAEQYPFLFYAAKYWPRHFLGSSASESVETRVLQLFQSSRCLFLNWVYLWNATRPSSRVTQIQGDMPRWNSSLPLYFASYLGLPSIISKLLGRPSPVQVQVGSNTTSAALLNQRLKVMSLDVVSVLSGAARQGHGEVVQLLLEHGARPDSKSLAWALRYGFEDIAKLLIKHGADVFSTGTATLCEASFSGHREMVQYLLDMGVDPNQHANHWYPGTPLLIAARGGHRDIARLLLERGARVDAPSQIRAAVLRSTIKSPVEISQALITFLHEEAGGAGAKEDMTWESLLLETPRVGNLETIRVLLKDMVGAGPQAGTIEAVLGVALRSSWAEEIVTTLLGCGVDVLSHLTTQDIRGVFDKESIFRLLIATGPANANLSRVGGEPALTMAAAARSKDLVKLSLAHGADINGRDWQGKTALSISTELGYTEIVQLLLEEGADIHTPDSHWGSPLRIALEDGRQAIAELLIKAGGDVDRRDAYGWNLLHWASWDGRLSVAEQLLGRGTPPTALDNLGRSPLFLAASAGRLALARMLLARAPSMKDRKDHYGLTPLSAAVIKGNTYVVQLLLAAQPADLECRDALGRNSVWWARRRGYLDIVQILVDEGRRRGILLEGLGGDDDLIEYPPFYEEGRTICDICGFANGKAMGCSLCNDGDFDICVECFELGGRCLDDSHVLQLQE